MSAFVRWVLPSLLVVGAAASAAAEERCGLQLDAEAAVIRRWPDLLPQTRAALRKRHGLDACARIHLRARDERIAIEVALPDGRRAVRSGLRSDDVVPTLEALLGVPELEGTAAVEPARIPDPEQPNTGAPNPSYTLDPQRFERRMAVWDAGGPHAPEGARIELGAAASARVGAADYSSASVGLLALVDVSRWLIGFQGRVAEYAWNPSLEYADSFGTLELGLLSGRRLTFEPWSLDFLAGPALALEAGATTISAPADSKTSPPEQSSMVAPRLVFASHLTWASGALLRGFVGLEGEAGFKTDAAGQQLPPWMVGIALGAVVGQP